MLHKLSALPLFAYYLLQLNRWKTDFFKLWNILLQRNNLEQIKLSISRPCRRIRNLSRTSQLWVPLRVSLAILRKSCMSENRNSSVPSRSRPIWKFRSLLPVSVTLRDASWNTLTWWRHRVEFRLLESSYNILLGIVPSNSGSEFGARRKIREARPP